MGGGVKPADDYTWGDLGRDAAKLVVTVLLAVPKVLVAAGRRLHRRLWAWALR